MIDAGTPKAATIVHSVPGRLRVKLEGVKNNPEFAEKIRQKLSEIDGVREVRANSKTGSLLLLYNKQSTDAGAIAEKGRDASVWDMDADGVPDWQEGFVRGVGHALGLPEHKLHRGGLIELLATEAGAMLTGLAAVYLFRRFFGNHPVVRAALLLGLPTLAAMLQSTSLQETPVETAVEIEE